MLMAQRVLLLPSVAVERAPVCFSHVQQHYDHCLATDEGRGPSNT